MPTATRQLIRRSLRIGLIAAAFAACNATGATAIPSAPRTPAPAGSASVGSASAGASGPSRFTTTTFSTPFSLTLPAGWEVGDERADMFTAYLSSDQKTIDVGVDIQLVPTVNVDPCDKAAGTTPAGSTATGLATWMLAYAPLAGRAGAPATIGGSNALVVDESFAGTPCVHAELWPTAGGFLDASERKRYFVFDVGASRLVAAIFSSDARFESEMPAALVALESLDFTP